MSVDQHFAVSEAPFDDAVSISKGFLRLHRHGDPSIGHYWTGDFVDQRGFVSIYRDSNVTRLDAVSGGRMHMRTWQRYYGDRTIARLARAFLTDLAEQPA